MNLEKTQEFIVNWIRDYSTKHSIKSLVVGISGGIDSALTSKLCALTGIHTAVVLMPIHQKKIEIDNAINHVKFLKSKHANIESIYLDLSSLFESFKDLFEPKLKTNLSLANSRARLRMSTLYQISGAKNGIVVGTGNKVEDFGIGFYTKYGDGGVDISPIADLNKSEVRKLAQFSGVSENILNYPPTDGLWDDGRNDENQIGATYQELEWAMNFDGDKNKITERQKKVIEIYKSLNKVNKHKMIPIPVCQIPKKIKSSL